MDFLGYLSMLIYVVSLYTQCLRYNICSAWFLDIRISTCYITDVPHLWLTKIFTSFHKNSL